MGLSSLISCPCEADRNLRSRSCGLVPFWASLLSCVGLFTITIGPLHSRPLAVFDEQLIMGASLQLVRLRMAVGLLSFPLHGLMTSRYRGESAVCLSSGRRGMHASHQIISYQIALSRIPRVTMVSRERVAPVPTVGKPHLRLFLYGPTPCLLRNHSTVVRLPTDSKLGKSRQWL